MTTTVYTFCWNEIFLLPHFFKNYEWADKIIVYDNCSDDGSRDFIESHPKGELRSFDSGGASSEQQRIDIKNDCWKGDTSDWVVVCDIDEFLIDHEKLEDYVGKDVVFDCKTWQMVSEEIPEDFDTVTLKYHFPPWDNKAICFSPRIEEINFGPGSHKCRPKPKKIVVKDVMEYKHFAALSPDYLINRWKRLSKRRLLAMGEVEKGWGSYYHAPEDVIRQEFRRRLSWAKAKRGH